MIIQTRYRDIPLEQARKCQADYPCGLPKWEQLRGQPVRVLSPPYDGEPHFSVLCKGPFYRHAEIDGMIVCIHIAEIGD